MSLSDELSQAGEEFAAKQTKVPELFAPHGLTIKLVSARDYAELISLEAHIIVSTNTTDAEV